MNFYGRKSTSWLLKFFTIMSWGWLGMSLDQGGSGMITYPQWWYQQLNIYLGSIASCQFCQVSMTKSQSWSRTKFILVSMSLPIALINLNGSVLQRKMNQLKLFMIFSHLMQLQYEMLPLFHMSNILLSSPWVNQYIWWWTCLLILTTGP